MKRMRHLSLCCFAVFGTSVIVGCTSPVNLTPWKQQIPEAKKRDPVVEILGLWQPAEGTGLDGLPARGFAGQLLFFTRGSKSPVKINGDVRIYVFDNIGSAERQSTPIDQFDFIDDTWQVHLHMGTLGPSYNVFIPYSQTSNNNQVKCSLRVKLSPKTGPTIYSDMVNVTLPGPLSEELLDQANLRAKPIEAQVQETLKKLAATTAVEGEVAEPVKPGKAKITTIPLQTSRDRSGRTTAKLASPEVKPDPAPTNTDPPNDRMVRLEGQMEQLIQLMANKRSSDTQQPPQQHRTSEAEYHERYPIQQVSGRVEYESEAVEEPRRFRIKMSHPLGQPLDAQHEAQRQDAEFDYQRQSARPHLLQDQPQPAFQTEAHEEYRTESSQRQRGREVDFDSGNNSGGGAQYEYGSTSAFEARPSSQFADSHRSTPVQSRGAGSTRTANVLMEMTHPLAGDNSPPAGQYQFENRSSAAIPPVTFE